MLADRIRTAALVAAAMVVAAVVIPLGAVLTAGPAYACSCVPSGESVYFGRADAVFSATLTDRREATLTFEVTEVYKGDVHALQQVATADSAAACGLEISGAGPFLVFADERRDAGPRLTASLCGGTRSLAAGDQPAFDSAEPPLPGRETAVRSAPVPLLAWSTGLATVLGCLSWLVLRRLRRR
ncbi:hypothetical protein [Streptomyces gobiensis]|uniref:hypothetical protein n=1 Tax=Streptomyces gobiensis TaxID=2875706 RepID=UPI001E3E85BC|nr:hypothetical protein [Streptomyces gobiensis]UGY94923.1 hypothetical protein test1122_26425 [Streptomyces gobiensis]